MTNSIAGVPSTVTESSSSGGVIPSGGVPVAVAVFGILPLCTSSAVTVYVAVPVFDSPGANVVFSRVMPSGNIGSFTTTSVNSTCPVFVTRKV